MLDVGVLYGMSDEWALYGMYVCCHTASSASRFLHTPVIPGAPHSSLWPHQVGAKQQETQKNTQIDKYTAEAFEHPNVMWGI